MIRYHTTEEILIAELVPGSDRINDPQDILDIMAEAGYNQSTALIIHEENLPDGFFDLKTKIAGEILQKFSNYRMKLAIIGDFSNIESKSLRDFIRESNRTGIISFTGTTDEALSRLRNKT